MIFRIYRKLLIINNLAKHVFRIIFGDSNFRFGKCRYHWNTDDADWADFRGFFIGEEKKVPLWEQWMYGFNGFNRLVRIFSKKIRTNLLNPLNPYIHCPQSGTHK
jgi:hypothetical protein